jgi:Family of unknown function (DUF6011)
MRKTASRTGGGTATVARSNRYAGRCADCGQHVPAEEGTLERGATGWTVHHPAGTCPTPTPARVITATTPGVYRHHGLIYVVKPSKRHPGRVYAAQLVESPPRVTEAGTEIPFQLEFRPGLIYDLTEADRMPLAEAQAITARYGRCIVCHRALKAAKSVEQGIGPVCAKYFATPTTITHRERAA